MCQHRDASEFTKAINDAVLELTRATLDGVILAETDLLEEANAGNITVTTDTARLAEFLDLLDTFNIVEP